MQKKFVENLLVTAGSIFQILHCTLFAHISRIVTHGTSVLLEFRNLNFQVQLDNFFEVPVQQCQITER